MCNNHDNKAQTINRRAAVRLGFNTLGAAGVAAMLPSMRSRGGLALAETSRADDHFLLQVMIPGGLDATSLFDARPLAMTAAGLQTNHFGAEPTTWTGTNGESCLATSAGQSLHNIRNDFSILNGVLMATTFDGHDQNTNYFVTGNPFGGEYFLPHLNNDVPNARPMPLDYIDTGFFGMASITNSSASAPLNSFSARNLAQRLTAVAPIPESSPVMNFIRARYMANANGGGKFSAASAELNRASRKAPELAVQLQGLEIDTSEEDRVRQSMNLAMQVFAARASRGALIQFFPGNNVQVDAHDPVSNARQPELANEVARAIQTVFAMLRETPFDATRSMLDVTTVLIGTEFSRTMRQLGLAIDASGTDHNPLTNTILIGGKGIRGGMVLGASDYATPEETLSRVHTTLDPARLKIMGRTFDFETMRSTTATPASFNPGQYLTMNSVANTIYDVFGVKTERHWLLERNGSRARVLTSLRA